MNIRYLGHSSFLIKAKEGTIVIDPFDSDMVGLPFPKVHANITLITHDHKDHDNIEAVAGDPFVIKGPGEYELSEIKIWGFPTCHDNARGAERGKNTVYLIETEGLTLCHLGDLGHLLEEKTAEEIGNPDVLFVPTGGEVTINHEEAAKVVAQLEPKIAIPMHFRASGMKESFNKLSEVSAFLEEMGTGTIEPVSELKLTTSTLPEEMEVVVMRANG